MTICRQRRGNTSPNILHIELVLKTQKSTCFHAAQNLSTLRVVVTIEFVLLVENRHLHICAHNEWNKILLHKCNILNNSKSTNTYPKRIILHASK